jgi:CHAT domain-containing protein
MAAYDAALPLYRRALAIALARFTDGFDPDLLGNVAEELCMLKREQGYSTEAIFYCKLAVNARQQQRAGARRLNRELRDSLTERLNTAYYALSALLAEAGRIVETEEVLLALKDSEYIKFVRGGVVDAIAFNSQEKPLADEINAIARDLAKVYAELEAARRRKVELPLEKRTHLHEQHAAFSNQLFAKFNEVSEMWSTVPALKGVKEKLDPSDTYFVRLSRSLAAEPGEANAVISYVVEERRTTVFVTDRDGPALLTLPVGSSTFNQLIKDMRVQIQNKKEYRQKANDLYRHLVVPVEAHLGQRDVQPKTLMLYLTDELRYLPFAALVDDAGRHLIEKYRVSVFTAAARENASSTPIPHWTVSAFGSTQPSHADMLVALPAVKDELAAIVRTEATPNGLLAGQTFMDEKFTRQAWQQMLAAESGSRNSVLHVASHFKVQRNNWNQSFLLLGNGERYRVSELTKAGSLKLDDLDLLTLSACSTEFTETAQEFEGLGALFQKKGARAVIGTLWLIQDAGSAAWMTAFYSARGEHRRMSKAAAVQSAQLKLLRGEVRSTTPGVDLTHPYYWAPYILMGNWL